MASLSDIRKPVEASWKRYEKVLQESLQSDEKIQQKQRLNKDVQTAVGQVSGKFV